MEFDSRIYVAGHRGLVGSAICRALAHRGYTQLIKRSHTELDLCDPVAVAKFFAAEQPEYVFLAAAFVGGIDANNRLRADFIYRNLAIQQHVIGESFRTGVKKLLFLGSSCIYPRDAEQPMSEEALLTGSLEYTNEPYAIAKIAGLKLCESFGIQYGANFIAAMPTNLYGPCDNYSLQGGHVLPALVRKAVLSRMLAEGRIDCLRRDLVLRPIDGCTPTESDAELIAAIAKYGIYADHIDLWGTGKPLREFLWSDDLAEACVYMMEQVDFADLCPKDGSPIRHTHLNVGSGEEISIAQLAALIAQTVKLPGKLSFDTTKPDGTMRKLMDSSRLKALGWQPRVSLQEGVGIVVENYLRSIDYYTVL